jgi:hypothetical protein
MGGTTDTQSQDVALLPRYKFRMPVSGTIHISDISEFREKQLAGYVRLARLDLPFLDMHPCRTIQVAEELKADLNDKVFWDTPLVTKTYHVLRHAWVEFLQDPRWEVKLIDRALKMAKDAKFTEVEFYDAYCKHVLSSNTTVYNNAVKVMTLFREERVDSGLSYGDF